jgi:hypothetical protein
MKIRYGTNPTDYYTSRAFILGCVLYSIFWYESSLQYLFGECQESIAQSRGLNVTKIPTVLYCEFPNEYCLCPVSLNTSNSSETCITNVQLVVSRTLPLFSYFLHIILVRELFSLSGNHRRFIIYVLWVISIFIFTGITISIYWSSCSQVYLTGIQGFTAGLLTFLSFHNFINGLEYQDSRSNHNRADIVHSSERINREKTLWKELL